MSYPKIPSILRFLLPFLWILPGAAFADGLSFTVNPMTKEITAAAGSQQTGTVELRNDEAAASPSGPLRVKIYLADWTLDPSGAIQFSAPATTAGSCASWFQVNPSELSLAPGASATIRYTINVPQNAAGTFHTLMMFETAPSPQTIDAREVAVNGRIGSTFYLQVGPQVKRANITAFEVTDRQTSITVRNTGTSQLRLQGTVKYADGGEHVILQVPIPNALLLPGDNETRVFCLDTPKLPRNSPITATVLLDYGGDVLAGARVHVALP